MTTPFKKHEYGEIMKHCTTCGESFDTHTARKLLVCSTVEREKAIADGTYDEKCREILQVLPELFSKTLSNVERAHLSL